MPTVEPPGPSAGSLSVAMNPHWPRFDSSAQQCYRTFRPADLLSPLWKQQVRCTPKSASRPSPALCLTTCLHAGSPCLIARCSLALQTRLACLSASPWRSPTSAQGRSSRHTSSTPGGKSSCRHCPQPQVTSRQGGGTLLCLHAMAGMCRAMPVLICSASNSPLLNVCRHAAEATPALPPPPAGPQPYNASFYIVFNATGALPIACASFNASTGQWEQSAGATQYGACLRSCGRWHAA